jgi:hypothetical protein
MHALCADELHARIAAITRRLLRSHKAISAPPSDEYREVAKEWIASMVADEAKDLWRHLWRPRAAQGENGIPDSLDTERQRELDRAYVAIDKAFDGLRRDRTERILRWTMRTMPSLGTLLRGMSRG